MCVVSALLESDQLTLPLTLVNFWQPLLQLFHQSHATPLLLEKLLQLQTDSGGLQDRLVVGWVAAVVTAIQEGCRSGSPLARIYEAGCEVDGRRLLHLCLRTPNRHTTHLLNRWGDALTT
ncbi:hypothetical protein NP493_506g02106 [Ridgeia piscesae]|uniref:Uncharacterized protein n=1 Tax=Ridgeia piscesae TaxID=27915 RepID=A0AAD9NSQ5_RIDPI|nr:hypothetical protein NP493_506g02106 [Ridgeia piscesae]